MVAWLVFSFNKLDVFKMNKYYLCPRPKIFSKYFWIYRWGWFFCHFDGHLINFFGSILIPNLYGLNRLTHIQEMVKLDQLRIKVISGSIQKNLGSKWNSEYSRQNERKMSSITRIWNWLILSCWRFPKYGLYRWVVTGQIYIYQNWAKKCPKNGLEKAIFVPFVFLAVLYLRISFNFSFHHWHAS